MADVHRWQLRGVKIAITSPFAGKTNYFGRQWNIKRTPYGNFDGQKINNFRPILLSLTFLIISCNSKPSTTFTIDYEKYILDNGLEVILHKDNSDPIVGVAIQYHVGSNREVPGRTGFAHLFEHMLFQESQQHV